MRVSVLLLAALVRSIVAEVTLTITASSATATSVACTTRLSDKSVKQPVPTTSTTTTLPPKIILIISASTPVSTITPQPVTTTTIQTAKTTVTTTATPISNTYSTTFTTTVTTTNTATTTVESTTTVTVSTTSTSVNHVPTAPGFVGVEDSTGETDYAGAKKRKRDAHSPLGGATLRNHGMSKKRTAPSIPKYPTSVYCIKYIQVTYTKKIVAIKPTTTTTAKPSTSIIATTTTLTSTSTVCPPRVTVTSSFTATATATAQTTTTISNVATTTTTVTEIVTSTQYDACQPTNLLGPRLGTGEYIASLQLSDADNFEDPPAENAVQCCEACIGNPKCILSEFYPNSDECYNVISTQDSTCANPNSGYLAANLVGRPDENFYQDLIVSNGNCGIIYRH